MIANQSKEAEEKFRTGHEREGLQEQKTKESETVAKFKEKIVPCKKSLELTIKILTGDSENVG